VSRSHRKRPRRGRPESSAGREDRRARRVPHLQGPAGLQGFGDEVGGAREAEKSLLSELIERFNARFGTEFTEEDVLPAFNATKEDPKVRAAALVKDGESFGLVFDKKFEENMMDHVSTIDALGKRHFGTDRDFKSDRCWTGRSP